MEIQILDVDYVLVDEKPVIRIFGKTEEGKVVCGFYDDFQPYFYIDDKKAVDIVKTEPNVLGVSVSDRKFIDNEKTVYKVGTKNPAKTPEIREKLKGLGFTSYEADILFKYRFMNDSNLGGLCWLKAKESAVNTNTVKTEMKVKLSDLERVDKLADAPLKILALDIECYSDVNPMVDATKDPIIMISFAFTHDYKGQKDLVISTRHGKGVAAFEDEKTMLEEFVRIVNEYDPDIITGFNINNFDMPYILERMRRQSVRAMFTRCETKPAMDKKVGIDYKITVTGRVVVDSFKIIKKDFSLVRYGLDFVAEKLLGEKKVDVKKSEIGKFWKGSQEDFDKLVYYSRIDSVLALNLVMKLKLMNKYSALSKVAGTLLQDSLDSGETTRIENFLLREFNKDGYIFPNRPTDSEVVAREAKAKVELKGGFVLEPEKGLHSEIVVFDFKSMYPSIIISFNMCPTTLVRKAGDLVQDKAFETPVKAYFYKPEIKKGIIPTILTELMNRRDIAKKKYKNAATDTEKNILYAEQWALKILANSFYGYFGYARGRMYDLAIANSVTSFGREIIHLTKSNMEKFGYKVVYGDSVTKDRFVTLLNKKGLVEVKNIEELFEENKNNSVIRPDGKEVILLKGYKALTTDPKTLKAEWSEITEIIRHKTNKKIYRVNQKFGETVVTEDHSIMVSDGGILRESRPTEIQKSIARVTSLPRVKAINVLDIYELLNGYEHTFVYKGVAKIAKFHCDESYVWFGWSNRKAPIRIKRFIKINSPEFDALCRLCGAYIAEGSSSTMETTSRYGASITCSDINWLTELQKDYMMLFEGAMSCVIESSKGIRKLNYGNTTILYKDKTHKLQMMNALASVVFKGLCGQKSGGKKIPSFAFHVPREKQMLLLKNMIKGDGYIETSPRYTDAYKKDDFRYDTKSLNLASGLSLLLTGLGKRHTIKFRKNKGVYRITACSDYNERLDTKVSEEAYEGYVYDLAVEKNHMFVDSCGQILLHNTDSVMVHIDEPGLDKIKPIALDIAAKITDELPGIIELQFEKVFKRFLPLSKKRYVAWKFEPSGKGWEESIEMKGVETVRRDWCLHGDTLIQLSDGTLKPIKDLPEKCEVLTINPDTLKLQKDFSAAKMKRKDKIYSVLTDFIEIKATEDHKFFVFSNGEYKFKKVRDLEIGDSIIQARKIEFDGEPQKINFNYERSNFRKNINIPTLTTEDFCQIMGFVFGDGSVAEKKVTLYNQDQELLVLYNSLFKRVFGIEGELYNGNNCYNLVFFSKTLEELFRHFGFNCKEKLPEFVHRLPKKQLSAFLKGYFDADGHMSLNDKTASKNKSYLVGGLTAKSRRVLEEVKLLLLRFGIWSSNLSFRKSLGEAYEFRLNCDNARLFLKQIGFSLKKLEYREPKYLKGKKDRLPFLFEAENLILKTGYAPSTFIRSDNQIGITKTLASTILDFAENNVVDEDDEYIRYVNLFRKTLDSDICFAKIEKIEELCVDDVYDIDTISTDTFLANGLLSHNCPLVSETMKRVIDIILKENDSKKALAYFKTVVDLVVKNKVDVNKLVITKGITRKLTSYVGVQPHVELAKKIEKRGQAVGVGDRLGYVIIKGNDILSKRVEDPAYVVENRLEVDSKYYIENQLLPPIERIFLALGVTKSELMGNGKQIGLFDVFKKMAVSSDHGTDNKKQLSELHASLLTGFICKICNRKAERPPLTGFCECGGHLLFNSDQGAAEQLLVN